MFLAALWPLGRHVNRDRMRTVLDPQSGLEFRHDPGYHSFSRGEALKRVIGSLRLEFTSAPFARAFEARNQVALQRGALSVRVVR